jgi:hypothetical protein
VDSPDPAGPAPATPTRWFQRVLPTSLLGLLVVALGVLVVPGVRDQLSLSTSHRSEPYVELYFARPAGGPPVACVRRGDRVRVGFVVASHLAKAERIGYRVIVAPVGKPARTMRKHGEVTAQPGQTHRVHPSFPLRRGQHYTVTVRLPALHQLLRARCPRALS